MDLKSFFNAMNTATARLMAKGLAGTRVSKHQASKKGHVHTHGKVDKPKRYFSGEKHETNHERVMRLRSMRNSGPRIDQGNS